ncbi:hypothetical protein SynA1825c_01311 [Synechococcus sp. A18-25c]|nr:hypothetical protein SynA1560_01324 [Synechococcus sp. A15-60]QNJ19618.1 hypothetical protein SynA1825c_01311 [Synechococcus sp. A18-25c]
MPAKEKNKADQGHVEQRQGATEKQRQHGALAVIFFCLSSTNRQGSNKRKNRNCRENFH